MWVSFASPVWPEQGQPARRACCSARDTLKFMPTVSHHASGNQCSASRLRRNPPLSGIARCLAVLLAWSACCVPPVRAGSVVTVNSDNVLVINGQKVFLIGLSPGPPNYGTTPSGKDALQELRDAGALIVPHSSDQQLEQRAYQLSAGCARLGRPARHVLLGQPAPNSRSSPPPTPTPRPACAISWTRSGITRRWGCGRTTTRPGGAACPVSNLLNGYIVIKQEDTNHPVVQTHAPRGTVADLQPYNVAADVLALDIYPVTAAGSASNPPITNTRSARWATGRRSSRRWPTARRNTG